MNKRNNILLAAAILLSILLFGCGGAEDGDLTPPNFTFDGGVPSVTNEPGTAADPHKFKGTTDPDTELDVTVTFPLTNPVATVTTPVIDASGNWSFDAYDLVEGSNIFAIDVSDPVGNSTVYYVTIFLDLTGPVVTIDQYPSPTPPGNYTIAGTSELGSTVDVDVLDDAGTSVLVGGPIVDIPTTDGNGVWSADIDLSLLANGTYTIEAEGFDIFDNPSTVKSTQDIVIDSAAPALVVTAPPVFPEVIQFPEINDFVNFTGTKPAGCDLSLAVTFGVLSNTDFSDSWSFTLEQIPAGNGLVTITTDGVGCSGTTTNRLMVVRDQTGPAVADIHPRNAEVVSVNTAPLISVTFSEFVIDTTIAANSTVLLENVTDPDNSLPVTLTAAGNDGVTFDFNAPTLVDAGKYKIRILNDEVTPVTILDERNNAFVGEASATFIVE